MVEEQAILARLRDCVVNLDIPGVQEACKDALAHGIPAYKAIAEGLSNGLEIVGRKYNAKEYFLADLMLAGEAAREGMSLLQPYLEKKDVRALGRILIGTVKGDLHDIGKNVVAMLLEAAGFEILDLGTDVSAEKFADAVRAQKPHVLGMSALLTTTMGEMQATVKEIEGAGVRSQVKVIIGGAPVSPEYGTEIGADAVGKDAVEGVDICKAWMKR
jgi:5-methyltetrahydrofolate--homocysteine methyltransferase